MVLNYRTKVLSGRSFPKGLCEIKLYKPYNEKMEAINWAYTNKRNNSRKFILLNAMEIYHKNKTFTKMNKRDLQSRKGSIYGFRWFIVASGLLSITVKGRTQLTGQF